MDKLSNAQIIEIVRDITVARISNDTNNATAFTGKLTAEYMQAVYDKLKDLNESQ